MMKYPDIQNRVQREIDEVAGRNRLPRTSDKMSYVEATLMEVQRIASIVPLGKVYMINMKADKYIFLSHIDLRGHSERNSIYRALLLKQSG